MIFSNLILCLVYFLIFYLTGKFLTRVMENDVIPSPLVLMARVVIGATFWVVVTAVYWTVGNTSMILLLLLGAVLLVAYRPWRVSGIMSRRFFSFEKDNILVFAVLGILLLVSVVVQYIVFHRRGETFITYSDWYFYVQLAEALPHYGIENTRAWLYDFFPGQSPEINQYHYYDLWLISFMTQFHKVAGIQIYINVYVPLFLSVSFLGIVGLLQMVSKSKKWWFFALFPMMFYIGKLPFFDAYAASRIIPLAPKIIVFYAIFPLAIASAYCRNWLTLSVLACALAVMSITYAAPIFVAVGLWGIWESWRTKRIKSTWPMLVLPVLTLMGFFIIYFVLQKPMSGAYVQQVPDGEGSNVSDLYMIFYYMVSTSRLMYAPLVFLPITLLIGLNLPLLWRIRKSPGGTAFWFSFVWLALCYVLSGPLIYINIQMSQLARNVATGLMVILGLLAVANILLAGTSYKRTWVQWHFPLMLWGVLTIYSCREYLLLGTWEDWGHSHWVSNEFLYEVGEALEGHDMGTCQMAQEKMDVQPLAFSIPTLNMPGGFVKHVGQNKWAVPLYLPDSSLMDIPRMALNPYWDYLKQNPDSPSPKLEFMRTYDLEFFIADTGVPCPQELVPYIIKEVHDPVSGKAVYVFEF